MKPFFVTCGAIAVSAAICVAPLHLFAQMKAGDNAKKADTAPTPKTADGHPDLTGLWGGLASIAIYAAGIAVSFWEPRLSCALYVAVALMWLVPDRRIESRLAP